jgi:hypothetical protein
MEATERAARTAAYSPHSARPKGPFVMALSEDGETVKITDAERVLYTYVFKPACPDGTHLEWTGAGLACVRD